MSPSIWLPAINVGSSLQTVFQVGSLRNEQESPRGPHRDKEELQFVLQQNFVLSRKAVSEPQPISLTPLHLLSHLEEWLKSTGI